MKGIFRFLINSLKKSINAKLDEAESNESVCERVVKEIQDVEILFRRMNNLRSISDSSGIMHQESDYIKWHNDAMDRLLTIILFRSRDLITKYDILVNEDFRRFQEGSRDMDAYDWLGKIPHTDEFSYKPRPVPWKLGDVVGMSDDWRSFIDDM